MAKNVRVIPANPMLMPTGKPKGKKERVEAQVDYYTDKIDSTDEWEMAGIYADEGITGTSLEK